MLVLVLDQGRQALSLPDEQPRSGLAVWETTTTAQQIRATYLIKHLTVLYPCPALHRSLCACNTCYIPKQTDVALISLAWLSISQSPWRQKGSNWVPITVACRGRLFLHGRLETRGYRIGHDH